MGLEVFHVSQPVRAWPNVCQNQWRKHPFTSHFESGLCRNKITKKKKVKKKKAIKECRNVLKICKISKLYISSAQLTAESFVTSALLVWRDIALGVTQAEDLVLSCIV